MPKRLSDETFFLSYTFGYAKKCYPQHKKYLHYGPIGLRQEFLPFLISDRTNFSFASKSFSFQDTFSWKWVVLTWVCSYFLRKQENFKNLPLYMTWKSPSGNPAIRSTDVGFQLLFIVSYKRIEKGAHTESDKNSSEVIMDSSRVARTA